MELATTTFVFTRFCNAMPISCTHFGVRTALMHILWRERMAETIGNGMGLDTIWSGYTFILGFLIVFRSNQAYSRFWESASGT